MIITTHFKWKGDSATERETVPGACGDVVLPVVL